jgi:hypothetical protein
VDPILRKWKCRQCGLWNEVAVDADHAVSCEVCAYRVTLEAPAEIASRDEEALRSHAVSRLSDRYAEARELVSPTEAHANLEWIIGARRNLAWDGVAFDRDMAQLALLWLQDLARELDGEASPALAPVLDEAGEWTADPRRAAARRLRMATRDFAEVIADDRAEGTGRR